MYFGLSYIMEGYRIEQRSNKNGLIDRYDVFDNESLYYNVVALATFSIKNHAEIFVKGMEMAKRTTT